MSSMRIVLVDPLGDVLFSGESWLASGPPSPSASYDDGEAEAEADDPECPETLRSGESGIFPVERAKPSNANGERAAANDLCDERAA
jgi:hypothetical protein